MAYNYTTPGKKVEQVQNNVNSYRAFAPTNNQTNNNLTRPAASTLPQEKTVSNTVQTVAPTATPNATVTIPGKASVGGVVTNGHTTLADGGEVPIGATVELPDGRRYIKTAGGGVLQGANPNGAITDPNQVRYKDVNPVVYTDSNYNNDIADLIARIKSGALDNQNIDVTQDPRYKAQMELAQGNVKTASQTAKETLNARGVLASDMTNDRLAQIQQDAMTKVNEIVPQLYSAILQENQNKFNNVMSAFGAVSGQDEREQNRSAQNQQATIGNMLNIRGQDTTELNNNRSYEMTQKSYKLDLDKFDWEKTYQQNTLDMQKEQNAITNAANRAQIFGGVKSKEDATVLGVPVGTQTQAAVDAAAARQIQLKQLAVQQTAAANAKRSADLQDRLSMFKMTGKAPSGLEAYGIKAGDELYQTPEEKLKSAQAALQGAEVAKQQGMIKALPDIKKQYGVNDVTAQAIYSVKENPDLKSALADYNGQQQVSVNGKTELRNTKDILRDKGVNLDILEQSIYDSYGVPQQSPAKVKQAEQDDREWKANNYTNGVNMSIFGPLGVEPVYDKDGKPIL